MLECSAQGASRVLTYWWYFLVAKEQVVHGGLFESRFRLNLNMDAIQVASTYYLFAPVAPLIPTNAPASQLTRRIANFQFPISSLRPVPIPVLIKSKRQRSPQSLGKSSTGRGREIHACPQSRWEERGSPVLLRMKLFLSPLFILSDSSISD